MAAITIVAYNGIQQRANLATLKIDMSSAAKALENANTSGGAYPATLTIAALRSSPGTTYQYTYTSSGNTYCLTGTNNGIAYTASTATPTPAVGVCPGHTPPVVLVNGGVVTTLAGNGATGFAGGTGTGATIGGPYGVTVDTSGNLYVSSTYRILKITSGGFVSSLAGSGTQGYVDGTGSSAGFSAPTGVAVDGSGNVYVADNSALRIRKVTSGGVVTTFAGAGINGSADGPGTTAQFSFLRGVAVDASGTVYVADSSNNKIRKITPAGVVSTLAGSGTYGFADGIGSSAQFSNPYSIAVDSSGNVYVADTESDRIRMITPAGVVTTFAGSGVPGFADGTGTAAQFYRPYSVAVDSSGTVYVLDYANQRIRKITPAGVVTTLAGSGVAGFADGTGTSAAFNYPTGIAVDSSGVIYVADQSNNRIRKIQ